MKSVIAPDREPGTTSVATKTTHAPGTYLGCTACGRLLRIHWPTRSVVCSCGARVTPPARDPVK